MSRGPLRAFVACVALGAALPASAFVRLTTESRQPDKGVCLWWKQRSITYVVDSSAFTGNGCPGGGAVSQAVQRSFPAWTQATRAGQTSPCTDFKFVYGGETARQDLGYDPNSNNVNLVVYRKGQCSDPAVAPAGDECHATPGACADKHNCWEHGTGSLAADTLALTTTSFDPATGEILDADVELNGWNGSAAAPTGSYFTCGGPGLSTCSDPPYSQSGCNSTDLAGTITHEAGHMLGLDHVCTGSYPPPYNACPSPTPVMAPTMAHGDTSRRSLSPDDVEAVCTIYPAGGPTTTCVSSSGSAQRVGAGQTSGTGCSTGEGGLALLAGVVPILTVLRRPRAAGP